MDKELPESALGPKPARTYIHIDKSNLPGSNAYKGNVRYRRTIDIEDIAQRIIDKRSEYRKETFVTTFNIIKEEIYNAIEDGFNVDFGFGRMELTVNGAFISPNEEADRKRHKLVPKLRPSPRLRQSAARIPLETEVWDRPVNAPRPSCVSLEMDADQARNIELFNRIPAGEPPFLNIYGDRLVLLGDRPGVGIRLRCLEDGEEYFFPPRQVVINSLKRLGFQPAGVRFTPGEWEVIIGSQFNPTYRPYKEERYGYLTFTVV